MNVNQPQPLTYEEVLNELQAFSLANAVNRNAALERVEEFINEIRPKIDQVLRENPNLTDAQKRAFDIAEGRIHNGVNTSHPKQANQGGGRRRKTRAARLRKLKQRKTRSARSRKGTRKH